MCEIRWCLTKETGTIAVDENIGDGCWRVMICTDCSNRIGIHAGGVLPEAIVVKRLIKGSSDNE